MPIKTIIVVCVLSLSLLGFSTKGDAEPQIILSPKEYISLYALKYGASEKELLSVAKCESSLVKSARGDGGKSIGIFQYKKNTFNQFSKLLGEQLDFYSYHDQAKLTAFVFAEYPKLKSHWTCWKKLAML